LPDYQLIHKKHTMLATHKCTMKAHNK